MTSVAQAIPRPPEGLNEADPALGGEDDVLVADARLVIAAADMPDSPDDALVRAALVGQREAFEELVRRYTNMILVFVNARLRDPVEAEEVTQETMVRAFTLLPSLRAPRAFANWLFQIATNVLIDRKRSSKRLVAIDDGPGGERAAEGPSPQEVLSREESREFVHAEIQKLPPHYRVTLALKYINGFSVDEIAERHQVPAGTVRARLSRAYQVLRRRLEQASSADSRRSGAGGTPADEAPDGESQ